MQRRFADRRDAGAQLARQLLPLSPDGDVVVLGLPRGGIPVAFEVALALGAPLDVFSVRKLGVPGHEELAMGAIGSDGAYVLNHDVIEALGIGRSDILRVVAQERRRLERRERAYREHRSAVDVADKVVILVDDGLATGATMLAAVSAIRRKRPRRMIVAVPVAQPDTCAQLGRSVDDVVCVVSADRLDGIGSWYDDFGQVPDEDVRTLLDAAAARGSTIGRVRASP
jgi:putative phosphoribosyl transferase